MKRIIFFAALVVAALSMSATALASATGAGTPSSTTCGLVNINYADNGAIGCYSSTTVTNNTWTIVNSTLQVTGSFGWVSTFTYQAKTNLTSGTTSYSGAVTDTTEYGTSTIVVPGLGTGGVPFGVSTGQLLQGYWFVPAGNIWADNSTANGQAYFNAQVNMVYNHGGQNAGYWFGSL